MSERSGIEIDHCPQCRGVWLDRGELDKILGRSAQYAVPAPPAGGWTQPAPSQGWSGRPPAPGYGQHDLRYAQKRKKSWLQDIID